MDQGRIAARRRGRLDRPRGSFLLAPMTLFLLGLTTVYILFLLFSAIHLPYCRQALVWLEGWPQWRAPLQLFAAIIGLSLPVWLMMAFFRGLRGGMTEFILQGLLIGAMGLTLFLWKAYLLPYGTPSFAEARRIADRIFLFPDPPSYGWRGKEDAAPLPPWPYDVPPPPRLPPHPFGDPRINPSNLTFDPPLRAPVETEFARLRQCAANHDRAIEDYIAALERLRVWQRRYGRNIPYWEYEPYLRAGR